MMVGRILHQHSPYNKKGQESSPPAWTTAETQDRQKTKDSLAHKPLLQKNPHRFVLFPIHHADIWRMYKKAKAPFWTTEEIDLSADFADWNRLSKTKRHFISHVLAFLPPMRMALSMRT